MSCLMSRVRRPEDVASGLTAEVCKIAPSAKEQPSARTFLRRLSYCMLGVRRRSGLIAEATSGGAGGGGRFFVVAVPLPLVCIPQSFRSASRISCIGMAHMHKIVNISVS